MPRTLEEPPPRRPAYFWWLLANALALCFAIVSWAVCLQVFGNPEQPRNYEILRKIGRLPVLKRYTKFDVPDGNSLGPKELLKYLAYSESDRARANSLLLRNYLTNFDRTLLLTYVEGDYKILEARELTPRDFFSPGIVVRAQAVVKPDDFTQPQPYPVFIEYALPTAAAGRVDAFKPGEILTLSKSPDCAVVVHIEKIVNDGEAALLLTAIPIAYGPHLLGDSTTVELEPPAELRPGAGLPIMDQGLAPAGGTS